MGPPRPSKPDGPRLQDQLVFYLRDVARLAWKDAVAPFKAMDPDSRDVSEDTLKRRYCTLMGKGGVPTYDKAEMLALAEPALRAELIKSSK